MTPAIALFTIAGILLVSGFKNQGIVDTMLGRENRKDTGNVDPGTTASAVVGNSIGSIAEAVRGVAGSGDYGIMVSEMNRISALGLRYLWGGGHAGYGRPNGPFDCSGAVSYVLHAAGYLHTPPLVSGGFMLWGKPGRGQDFTVYANPTHVFIKDEHTGRCWGTTKTVGPGGPQWHNHTTKGFVARHPG